MQPVRSEILSMRVTAAERAAFERAADAVERNLSSWARDRLKRCAREELEPAGKATKEEVR